MICLRTISAVTLAFLLVVTGVGMSVARADMAARGDLFCIGGAQIAVLTDAMGLPVLDADGDPVTVKAPWCPDCVIGAFAPSPVVAMPAPPITLLSVDLPAVAPSPTARTVTGGHGRDPPVRA
jgi:hypothetical protein